MSLMPSCAKHGASESGGFHYCPLCRRLVVHLPTLAEGIDLSGLRRVPFLGGLLARLIRLVDTFSCLDALEEILISGVDKVVFLGE